MYKLKFCFFTVLPFVAVFSGFSQSYEINISLPATNDSVWLAHIFAREETIRGDTVIVLNNGKGVFSGNRALPKGLYWIVNNKRPILQILIGDNQKFGIEIDTTDIINATRFISSPDNDIFYGFMRDDMQRQRNQILLREQFQNTTDDAERNRIAEQSQALAREKITFIKNLVSENEELYASKFLKALLPLELPEHPRDAEGKITDSTYVYRWYRANFFSNFDVLDPDMLRTPGYEAKLMEYMAWFTRNHPPDTVCAEMDRMLTRAIDNKELLRCMMATMLNFIGKEENQNLLARDNYWVHLVDNWYVPHADWANVEEMKENVDKIRHTLVGKPAPPLEQLLVLPPEHFKAAALNTAVKEDMHAGTIMTDFRRSVNSKFLILLFWDINCGGCRETIQKVWELHEACKNMGLQVITVQTNWDQKTRWVDFINQHEMFGNGWYNAWIIYDLNWTKLYNTAIVPQMYVLNEKKEIMFKGSNLDLDWLQTVIENSR